MPQYKHIFFDLDHTLWDFDKNAESTLTDVYAHFSLDTRVAAPFNDFYRKYLYHNEKLWARYQNGFITAEELKWRRMWRTLLDFKIADEPLAKDISGKFMDILPTKQHVFDYTHEILQYLLDKNYVLHLITNGFEKTQWSKLKHSGLEKYFTHMITSETSNSLKPKKEIFDYAMNKAGATLPESIMIGDNLDADIQGALNAGMDCIFVNHIGAVCPIQPTYSVTHLKELETIF
ncbi:YjjG family noncanonical pyrimidine nucleotidase [Ferruginibacter sp. HRS2-29]|uniref:YjjG family noncanonical pyrimidine nucleotidase n=1 Tax=Ferruginibacter sp. HRS2-29 TaxID=2487334 RepID=UPI0020CBDE28|nr:YjjG family noncanonical pyrimidine nucleotidase [Ferruginibacter sp. HRS2-29]MCP9750467.1 noncanonical pyrimidine nucleotidase, YjjG family [Ferruginibacter sp. HRS2-29]